MENKIDNHNAYAVAFEMLSDFEKKALPFGVLYKGFPVWLGIRQYVYTHMVGEIDHSIAADFGSAILNWRMFTSYVSLFIKKIGFINRSPIFKGKIKKGKYLIFNYESCRRATISGKSINIFIDPIRMLDINNEIAGIEVLSPNNYTRGEKFYTFKQYDLLILQSMSLIAEKFYSLFLKEPPGIDKAGLSDMLNNADLILSNKKEIYKLINNFIIYFDFLAAYWKRVFEVTQPKLVVGTNWYSRANMVMFFVANQMGIPTVEMLHGFIAKYYTGYIFKDLHINKELECVFPRHLIVFGKYDKDTLMKEGTLWKENAIFDLGYPWLDYSLNANPIDKLALKTKINIKDGTKILTITSQFTLQKDLINTLLGLKIPEGWIVVIKIHPLEAGSYKKTYSVFLNMPRLKFVTDRDISFYDLLRISNAHASFYSSSLWEAAAFGIANYIIDHSTKELVQPIEDLGLAKVSSVQDIFNDNYLPNRESLKYAFSNLDGSSSRKYIDFFKSLAN